MGHRVSEEQEQLRTLLEVSLGGIVIHEMGVIRLVNRAITELFGYSEEDLVGASALTFVAPESQDRVKRQIAQGLEDVMEFTGLRKDGSTFEGLSRGKAIMYQGRQARITSIQDVTVTRRAVAELRASEQRLQLLNEELERRVNTRTRELSQRTTQLEASRRDIDLVLSSLPNLMFVYDADDRFSAFYAREDHPDLIQPPGVFIGKHFEEVLPQEVAGPTREALREVRAMGEGVDVTFEYSLVVPTGRLHFEASLSRIGSSPDVLGVVSNITERKRAEAQLLRIEKMAALGQLLAGVAHEINNPVNFMYGNISLLADACANVQTLIMELLAPSPTDAQRDRIEAILGTPEPGEFFADMKGVIQDCTEGTRRVREIVQSLRSFAHPERDRRIPTDVRHCLDNALTLLSHELGDRIRVVREIEEVSSVRADPAQLNQVFTNLLVNATQAIDGEGEIHLRVADEGPNVAVVVRDTGGGIPETDRDRVFEPFFTTKEIGKGTGLGLAICYGIVEAHGGSIELESTLGQGSTFTVRLPRKR